jgi:hypothetical protein
VPGRVPNVKAATATLGGINVEPAARPWRYVGANPDGWWCPVGQCSNSADPLARIDTEMSLAHQLNVANVRIEIPWFLVEPSNGGYDWTRADYIFNSASSHGVQINPILVYTPAWAGGYNAFPAAATFGAFVSAFMGRYGGRITAVEMWNEPDGGQSLIANDPTKYVNSILIPGYNAVKSSHPNVKVIEGGSINDSGTCCAWLSGIYAAGGGNYFDIAAFHDYGGNYAQIAGAYQGVLNAHGQGGKPIWLGEFGVSDPSGGQQSSLIYAAMANTAALAVAQFYTLRDESVYTCCPPAATGEAKQYGVLTSTYVKKSSFNTIQSLLGGQSPPPPPPPPPPSPPPASSPTPAASPVVVTPSPSHAASSPSGGTAHSPSTSPGSPGASPNPVAGFIGSSTSPSSLPPVLQGAITKAETPRVIYSVLVVIGLLILGYGLALATNLGALVTSRLAGTKVKPSGEGFGALGIGLAACGAIFCAVAIMLLSQAPSSG